MNIIDNIKIENLWGEFSVNFQCDDKFNFLIGQNGTGKTTVINLIAAALTGDFERLDKTEFDRIIITFKTNIGKKKPSIEVKKTRRENIPFYDISYIFKQYSKDTNPIIFDFGAMEQERFFRGIPSRAIRDKMIRDHFLDIRERLDSFVKVTWLSVHRNEENRLSDERKTTPAIDQKLNLLSNSLMGYFSLLASKYSDEIVNFQKNILLSILTSEGNEDNVITSTGTINTEKEQKALSEIFEVLGVDKKKYSLKIKKHFEKFEEAKQQLKKRDGISTKQFATIYDTWRSHDLVQKYEELKQTEKNIFKSKDNFLSVINELLEGRKEVFLSERNALHFKTKNNRPISIEELSSGEKQLLIILGEALLQEEKHVVYIADEPELSLHISWQETLTDYISKLNPNAQILFATHSPDIVGKHSDKLIKMKDVIK
ncbi:MAG: AAA family ATPase [Methylococcaceae bacterium]